MSDTRLDELQAEDAATTVFLEGQLELVMTALTWWRWIAAGIMGLVLLLGIGVLILLLRSQVMPWIVVVDPDMKVLWHGPQGAYQLKDLDIAKWLAEWVLWVRQRPGPDETPLLRQWWTKAIDMTSCGATKQLDTYFAETSQALKDAQYQPVRVLVQAKTWERESALRYRLSWDEIITPQYGAPVTQRLSGTFTVVMRATPGPFGPKLTAGDMNQSPLGVFVCEFSWSEVMQEAKHP